MANIQCYMIHTTSVCVTHSIRVGHIPRLATHLVTTMKVGSFFKIGMPVPFLDVVIIERGLGGLCCGCVNGEY